MNSGASSPEAGRSDGGFRHACLAALGLGLLLACVPLAAENLGYGPERGCRNALPTRLDLEAEHLDKLARRRERLLQGEPRARADGKPIRVTLTGEVGSLPARGKLAVWSESREALALGPALAVALPAGEPAFGVRRFYLRRARDGVDGSRARLFSTLCEEGILQPRTAAIPVTLNREPIGTMLLIEAPAKEMLEHQQRRNGVLFRLEGIERPTTSASDLPWAQVVPLDRAAVLRSDTLSGHFDVARALVHGFVQHELPADAVFDLDATARFLAVAAVWDAEALLRGPNLRFYFNPVTQRIEPVAFDGALAFGPAARSGSPPPGDWNARFAQSPWASRLLEDDRLRAAVHSHLARLTGVPGAGELVGSPPEHTTGAHPDRVALAANPIPTATHDDALSRHRFLDWNPERNAFTVQRGIWQVEAPLILPEGAGLEIGPGTTLRFPERGLLVASGPLRFSGTERAPVLLEGSDSPFGPRSWQGIVVLRSPEPHHWSWVRVRNTSGIDSGSWHLTGGVTIRDSSLRIENSTFEGNRAEDALNLIRSRFELVRVSVHDTPSDGLDADFCHGEIEGGHFRNIGGDAIDISGSRVEVRNVALENVRDKALSVGEGSYLRARNISVRNSGAALASKDASLATIEDSTLSEIHHAALMAYVKKPEYGPAAIHSQRLQLDRVDETAQAQRGSRIEIDGMPVDPSRMDAEELYRDGFMQK